MGPAQPKPGSGGGAPHVAWWPSYGAAPRGTRAALKSASRVLFSPPVYVYYPPPNARPLQHRSAPPPTILGLWPFNARSTFLQSSRFDIIITTALLWRYTTQYLTTWSISQTICLWLAVKHRYESFHEGLNLEEWLPTKIEGSFCCTFYL